MVSKEKAKSELRTWTIERNEDSESIFDIRMQLELLAKKGKELQRQLQLVTKEAEYKGGLMWDSIESHLEISHDTNLQIVSEDSDMNKLTIREQEESDDEGPAGLLKFLRDQLGS